MVALWRDWWRMASGNTLPRVSGATASLAVNYPILSEPGLLHPLTGEKIGGSPVGLCGENGAGGIFYYGAREIWGAKLTEDANSVRFGQVGEGKSTGEKIEIIGEWARGLRNFVTDFKGEYLPLAEAIPGSRVLNPGTDSVSINALDSIMPFDVQLDMVKALVLSAMNGVRDKLTPTDINALRYAVTAAHADRSQALLQHVHTALREPSTEAMAKIVNVPDRDASSEYAQREYAELTRTITNALDRLVGDGDLAGTFDKPTTPGLFGTTPLFVLYLKDLAEEKRATTLVAFNFILNSRLDAAQSDDTIPFHVVRHDEAWKLLGDPGFLNSVIELYKLGNSKGIANRIVAHHPVNLLAVASKEAVRTLIGDATTRILHALDPDLDNDAVATAQVKLLGFTEYELKAAKELGPLQALYKVGTQRAIKVDHRYASNLPFIYDLVETRTALRKV